MAPDIASRIRAKLSKRRHSLTPSLASSRTAASDQSQTQAQSHGRDHSQPRRGDTASSSTGHNRSWSLRGHSQTQLVDDDAQLLKANGNGHGHPGHGAEKRGSTPHSDASSSIGPLDVVNEKQPQQPQHAATAGDETEKEKGQDRDGKEKRLAGPLLHPPPSPAAAPTATARATEGAAGSASPGPASNGPSPSGSHGGSGSADGSDRHLHAAAPSPSPLAHAGAAHAAAAAAASRPGAAAALTLISNLHSIHEDDPAATPTSTEHEHDHTNTTTDTEAGFDPEPPTPLAGPQTAAAALDSNLGRRRTKQRPQRRDAAAAADDDDSDDANTGPWDIAFVPPTPTTAAGFFSQQPAVQTPPSTTSAHFPPPGPVRRQSLLSTRQSTLIKTLLHPNDSALGGLGLPIDGNMVTRKIWVRRPNASATMVTIGEEDLVDDVRDMILRKYANSLGRTFDAPDLTIKIHPREQQNHRVMGPEEPMGRTLDAYFPGGQTVDEALVIDIPIRRTPKASPRAPLPHHGATVYYNDDGRPSEAGEGYFPPIGGIPSPRLPVTVPVPPNSHSIAVLGTGHIPPIPSPGGTTRSRAYKDRPDRPRLGRTHTSSPTIITNGSGAPIAAGVGHGHGAHHYVPRGPHTHSRTHSEASDQQGQAAAPLPTSPIPDQPQARVNTPPPRVASPRPSAARLKKSKKNSDHPSLPPGMLNGSVPPINVLIVEDNPINLKLLEAFVKRLKVRWDTAMNGFDAVKKWRTGGFHLVLMDIQLPGMNGLEATREIRRLERINSIGVFSSSPGSSVPEETNGGELQEQDRLGAVNLFKSPVIIVALTASSLQSDRHEALAAGCNDFLTKPVNFVWLERKVMEWGCMQALIDFDGWRKWKDFSQERTAGELAKKTATAAAKAKAKRNRSSLSASATAT